MKTGELIKTTGVTGRQLDHWVRRGYIEADLPGSGHHRVWPEDQVRRVRNLVRLTNAGVELEVAAAVASQLEEGQTEVDLGGGVTLELEPA